MAELNVPFYLKGWTPRFDNDGYLTSWVKDGDAVFRPSAHWDHETKRWSSFIKGTVRCYSLTLRELIDVLEVFERGQSVAEEADRG